MSIVKYIRACLNRRRVIETPYWAAAGSGMVFVVVVCTLNSCGCLNMPLVAVDHVLPENPH